MPSVSLNYFIARRTRDQTGGSFESRQDFFTDHEVGFAASASAAAHQLHHPQRNDLICFDRQQHQRIDHPTPFNSCLPRRKNGHGSALPVDQERAKPSPMALSLALANGSNHCSELGADWKSSPDAKTAIIAQLGQSRLSAPSFVQVNP